MKRKILTSLLSVVAASCLYGNDTNVKEQVVLSDVIITAQKEEDKLIDVPVSVSVITEKDIDEQNIVDTYDIVNSIGGLSMIKTGHHGVAGFLSLRGITPTMEGDQSLGFFVDDIYFPMFDTEILDIQRVEVLKGPQSTLYGRNTESGVINIITNKPQNETSGLVSVDIGNYNTQKYKAIVNAAINDKVYTRAAFRKYDSDGYFTNTYNSNDKLDKIDGYDGRVSLRYLPSDKWDLILAYDKSDYDNGYTGFTTLSKANSNPGDVSTDFDGESLYESDKLSLKAVYEADEYMFTSITASGKTKNNDYNDVDFTTTDASRLKIDKDVDFFSQEFRVNVNSSDKFDYLVGAYFADQKDDQTVDYESRGSFAFSQITNSVIDTSSYALFTQGNYIFSDLLNITAGIRYNKEEKEIDYYQYYNPDLSAYGYNSSKADKSKDYKQLLPKLSFNFNVEDSLIYLSYSKGYKSGGFNPLAPSTDYLSYDEEESYNYEVGIKSTLLEDKLFATLSLYHIEIDNQQVEIQVYPDSITSNAAKSTVDGVDLELKYQANDNTLLSFGGSFNDSEFDEYTDNTYSGSTITGTKSYAGNMAPNTPKYSYNVSGKYTFSKETYLLGKLNAYGKIYYDLDNTVAQDSYETFDMTFSTKLSDYGFKLWGKNIFDEGYTTRAFEMEGEWYARTGSPRTFGVEISKKF